MKLSTTIKIVSATAALCTGLARADTYTVTSLFDSGVGTLRSAVAEANAHPGADIVEFHPALSGVLALQSTIFVIGDLQIIGTPTGRVTLDLASAGTGIYIQSPTAEVGFIDIEAVNGGSFLFSSVNRLRLNVHRCIFRDIGVGSTQAGVFNPSWLDRTLVGTVHSSSFINNYGLHAGVFISNSDPAGEWLEFENCTFDGNGSSHGGGVAWLWNPSLPGQGGAAFTNCTITGNSGGEAGMAMGAIHISGVSGEATLAACRVKNSVVSDNAAGAPVEDANFTGLFNATDSLEGNNILAGAQLRPLEYAGGFYVRTPMPGSPCIDAGAADASVRFDQVGTRRPQVASGVELPEGSDGADIGAVEVVPAGCAADINHSGSVTVQDLFDFLSAFFAGCNF